MNIAQKLVQEGVEEGIAKGIAKGIAIGEARGEAIGRADGEIKAKMEIARSMIAEGYNLETISQLTKLPVQKIKELY